MKPADDFDVQNLANIERLPSARVPVASLVTVGSPRIHGENPKHVRLLCESAQQLPPILVHRPTMRVIDGMHRLQAAKRHGEETIEVRFFDGDEPSSYVLAIRANIMHGLPLSLADRKVAVARVIELYPQWSDRMIADATGLSAKTVALARRRSTGEGRPTEENRQFDVRVGRDGKTRPVNGAGRRKIAADLMAENPEAPLREVAKLAGISHETARSVRAQLRPHNGLPERERPNRAVSGRGEASAVAALRADPAFRSTDSGRLLLRMLAASPALEEQGKQLVADVPAHCMGWLEEAVKACAHSWQEFGTRVTEQRDAQAIR